MRTTEDRIVFEIKVRDEISIKKALPTEWIKNLSKQILISKQRLFPDRVGSISGPMAPANRWLLKENYIHMKVKLGFTNLEYNVEGVPFKGGSEVLCDVEGDLTARRNWHKEGYTIKRFLPEGVYLQFHEGMEDLFKKCLHRAGLVVPQGFRMSQYHHLVKNDYEKHLKVIEQTKLLQRLEFPIHMSIVEAKVSEIITIPVESRKPMNGERVFHFRVVRPGEPDFNPIHRDAWQEENKGAINIYVPLAGSNTKSSLLLVPGSHLWPESTVTRTREGAIMNGIKFNVPGVMDSSVPLKLKCPNPGLNKIMVFSPYLLHGGSMNRNKDVTRVSLEMRFWPKKLI